MKRQALTALLMVVIMTVIGGVVYPLMVTGIAQIIFPYQANGSMVIKDGRVVGSKLIGQNFTSVGYFHGRPSAAGKGYDATLSSGSNLGPTNRILIDEIKKRADLIRKENRLPADALVPSDLVTASASGLDPDISVEAAYLQVPRIAKVWGISEAVLKRLIDTHIKRRQFGILGEERVNVLELNVALDDLVSRISQNN
ncbi:K+-transporting ATPase ATPase C chain [Caldicoprobacter guelmensis]|nr:K+-transporting ATPase ATPase C chain [Caldicoprobacter guelmensis]